MRLSPSFASSCFALVVSLVALSTACGESEGERGGRPAVLGLPATINPGGDSVAVRNVGDVYGVRVLSHPDLEEDEMASTFRAAAEVKRVSDLLNVGAATEATTREECRSTMRVELFDTNGLVLGTIGFLCGPKRVNQLEIGPKTFTFDFDMVHLIDVRAIAPEPRLVGNYLIGVRRVTLTEPTRGTHVTIDAVEDVRRLVGTVSPLEAIGFGSEEACPHAYVADFENDKGLVARLFVPCDYTPSKSQQLKFRTPNGAEGFVRGDAEAIASFAK